jgi:hypothetical protein
MNDLGSDLDEDEIARWLLSSEAAGDSCDMSLALWKEHYMFAHGLTPADRQKAA